MPSNTVQISGPAVGAAQILIWSYSSVFVPPMSTAIRTSVCFCVCVCVWELSVTFYIFHRHRVCLVDPVDLICSLYSWWFWVFFLSHTAPVFQLWFYFHLCMWVIHWGLLLRLPWMYVNLLYLLLFNFVYLFFFSFLFFLSYQHIS